jgi:hypothetical protein
MKKILKFRQQRRRCHHPQKNVTQTEQDLPGFVKEARTAAAKNITQTELDLPGLLKEARTAAAKNITQTELDLPGLLKEASQLPATAPAMKSWFHQHFLKTVKTSVEKKFCSLEQIDSLLQILEEKIVDQKQVYASKPFTSNTYGKVLVDTVEERAIKVAEHKKALIKILYESFETRNHRSHQPQYARKMSQWEATQASPKPWPVS